MNDSGLHRWFQVGVGMPPSDPETSTSTKLESSGGMWAEGRRAGFGCRLHTSSGVFAG